MSCEIKRTLNKIPKTEDKDLSIMSMVEVKKARTFHEGIPQYQVTPLADLENITKCLGLAKTCVKDESYRFGLGAFKVLGGSYVTARYIAKKTKRDVSQISYSVLTSRKLRDEFGQATFFSATDDNHGRSAAWAADRLGRKCVIHVPVRSTENRRRHIEDKGAECTIKKMNYDDCVRMVAGEAKHARRGVVIRNTAWEDYEEIPSWIMQGYSTMTDEAVGQFEERLTHVFVQVDVESLAGDVVGYFVNKYKKNPPMIIVVEAEPATCLYKGAKAADGEIHIVDGGMPTIMAGLCCDEPNITSQDILKNHVTAFLTVNNDVARRGIRMLAAPFKGDLQIISGEFSAVTSDALATIMRGEACRGSRLELGLDQDSRVLMFSTKGDMDPDRYKTIVWGGELK